MFAAVSSFDALVNLFRLNKYSTGSLRVADTAALADRPVFTPEMDTLFFVPDVLNLPVNAAGKKKFIVAAQKAYPPSAPVYLADCASISSRKTKVIKGKIGTLRSLLSRVNERHTIFIPAVNK